MRDWPTGSGPQQEKEVEQQLEVVFLVVQTHGHAVNPRGCVCCNILFQFLAVLGHGDEDFGGLDAFIFL